MMQTIATVVALVGLMQTDEAAPTDEEVLRSALHWNGAEGKRDIQDVVIVKNRLQRQVIVAVAAAGLKVELVRSHWECVVHYTEAPRNREGAAKKSRTAASYIDTFDIRR